MGSTILGMAVGIVIAAYLTTHYADTWNDWVTRLALQEEIVAEYHPGVVRSVPAQPLVETDAVSIAETSTEAVAQPTSAVQITAPSELQPEPAQQVDTAGPLDAVTPSPTVRDEEIAGRWASYAREAHDLAAAGEYRWRQCFTRAAAAHGVPETLLLAVASGESGFDPAARSDKDAIGVMQIRWPDTSHHLGVLREADLYDPCTNIAAGARYLAELTARFDNNLHRAVAAYNYGPTRLESGPLPDGARWYSQYIFQHLQRVLGRAHVPTSELIPPVVADSGGFEVLFRFSQPYRARDFVAFIQSQVPGVEVAHRSETLGQHEVVLLYRDEAERLLALDSLRDVGLAVPGQHIGIPRTF